MNYGAFKKIHIKIIVNSVRDSGCQFILVSVVAQLSVLVRIGHESHFDNRNRNLAPVYSAHTVSLGNAPVFRTGLFAQGVKHAF